MHYSETEFENIYNQCFPSSMRLALSLLHDEEEAKDIVHDVFLRLWETKLQLDNPLGFIIRSVRNACLNRLSSMDIREKIKRRLTLDTPLEYENIEQRNEDVNSAVKLILTQREQEVINNIYVKGMSYMDAADNLGVSVATINKNIVVSMKKLRNYFNTNKS